MSDNKTILKNSIFLYGRTAFTIIISLYTSRVFLQLLGVEDFGIYNLVGGLIAMFSFVQTLMTNATQRYLSIDIGAGNIEHKHKIMDISIAINILIALTILVVGETIGLYFLKKHLNIPLGKEEITYIVYHVSLLTTVFSMMKTPYSALMVAHEKMGVFAYISVFDSLGKLLLTFVLAFFSQRLLVFSVSYMILSMLILLYHILYCHIKLNLPRLKFYSIKGNPEYRELFSFSLWILVGNSACVMRDQGMAMVFNVFYGVVINAAMGIANQVSNVYSTLFSNIQMAFMPQIVQNSISDDKRYSYLVNRCCTLSFALMGLVCLPMIMHTPTILRLWLGNDIPDYTVLFVQAFMIKIMIVGFSQGLYQALVAIGRIKEIQIGFTVLSILTLIAAYIIIKSGYSPFWAFLMIPLMDLFSMILRTFYIVKYTSIDCVKIFKPLIMPSIIIFGILSPCCFYISTIRMTMLYVLISLICFLVIYSLITYHFLLLVSERKSLAYYFNKTFKKYTFK